MRKFITTAALLLQAAAAFGGTITGVSTRAALGANDSVEWGTAADDFTFVSSPYARTSVTNGVGVSAVLAAGTFAIWLQNGVAYVANFTDGDVLLDTSFSDGPITLNFSAPISGIGFNIAHLNFGSFTGTLTFYGAGNTLFGSTTVTGTSSSANDGSAPFLGGRSSLTDITRVDISVNNVSGSSAFTINRLSLISQAAAGVPEPATVTMYGAAALFGGLALVRRRRKQ